MRVKTRNPIDRRVDARIRMQRIVRGLSQGDLGKAVGVSFQQVQKYEKGSNRIGASRLQQIASALEVRPDFFFDGASAEAIGGDSGSSEIETIEHFISSRDGVALVKAFVNIKDAKTRRGIVALVEQIAAKVL